MKMDGNINKEYFSNSAKRFGHAIDDENVAVLNAVEVIAEYCDKRTCHNCILKWTQKDGIVDCQYDIFKPCNVIAENPDKIQTLPKSDYDKMVERRQELMKKHDIPTPKPKQKYWIWTIHSESGVYNTNRFYDENGVDTIGNPFQSYGNEKWINLNKEKTSCFIEV